MPKVGARIGLTVKLTKDSQYEFIRPEISIDEIDTEGDVDAQLVQARESLRKTFEATEESFNEVIVPQLNRSLDADNAVQLSKRLKEFENRISDMEINVKKIVTEGKKNESKTDKSGATK